MTQAKKTPAWMTLSTDSVVVALTKAVELNGVQCDKITLRAPTVRDVRAANIAAGGDDEQRELALFSSLAEVGSKDLEGMTLKDYQRLQAGYFRLVQDDEL
ncbi:Phage tail assembly chaperone protein, E, or 41 or 14 [Pseudomonas saponiphila]|uniref:Phage tail assembly chaperone protein, E, or 41 or 14 n=1 Tax=Pseudomonas saponiphila TaxID=556534 RepID=A0A1H4Y387_9PSED|nr:phage tail assembly protein [Pseudomonas saponiphila]SED12359.1 Phage tail assembly chaperone protein, E, or 41 or 14 [Pseudomonas saponiphila]